MTRDQRRDIFEAAGLIAIVASLVFLAMEVRQSNLATLIAARDSAAQGHMDYLEKALDSSILAGAVSKPADELTPLEVNQLERYFRIRWRHYDRLYFLYKSGVYSEVEWEGYKQAIINSLTSSDPGLKINQGVWQRYKAYFSPDFVSYVEAEIR